MLSIEHLTDTRSELRLLDVAVVRYDGTHADADRQAVADARARLDAAFERYLAEPETYPGEQALWADMHHALSLVNQAVERALDDVVAGRLVGTHVSQAIDVAATAIRHEVDFNADRARELALKIERDHSARAPDRHPARRALSTLFTGLVAFLAVRALSHYHRVVAERNELVARRAEELEMFAGRVAHDVLGPLSATRLAVSHVSAQAAGSGAAAQPRARPARRRPRRHHRRRALALRPRRRAPRAGRGQLGRAGGASGRRRARGRWPQRPGSR